MFVTSKLIKILKKKYRFQSQGFLSMISSEFFYKIYLMEFINQGELYLHPWGKKEYFLII